MKGWYVCANPQDSDAESTAWYAGYWAFLSGYLGKRFGKRYCLNPEASLLLQTGNTVVPRQVVVVTKEGGTSVLKLPSEMSLLLYEDENRVPKNRVEVGGLQVYPVPEALALVPATFFRNHPRDAQIALSLVRDASELLSVLLTPSSQPAVVGRLVGALRFVERSDEADRIVNTMKSVHLQVRETNPFAIEAPSISTSRERSPYVLRLDAMWHDWREEIIRVFPAEPGLAVDAKKYLAQVQERYTADAYNSLSIEGYQVTEELIERVATGGWDPDQNPEDKKDRDALAARGYYESFKLVKESLRKVLARKNAGETVQKDHHDWYAALFSPAVTAGIVTKSQLAGYRTGPVYIRNSMHTPLPRVALLDAMEKLLSLLTTEPNAAVRAVLGHHLFVFIHPYFDGNGRLARFLLNVMLASGGYPWTVVRMKRRRAYMSALEDASVRERIESLANFIAEEMQARS